MFETVLSVPLQEMGMRAFELSTRQQRAARFVYEALHAIEVVYLS